jgi:hypothetical protein
MGGGTVVEKTKGYVSAGGSRVRSISDGIKDDRASDPKDPEEP